MPHKSKDAQKVLNFDITVHTKGFISETIIDGNIIKEYFQYKEIHQVIHHFGKGIEIIGYNNKRRVFYNDVLGEAEALYDAINETMTTWMNSNLN